jgi:hypothetical protein
MTVAIISQKNNKNHGPTYQPHKKKSKNDGAHMLATKIIW